MHRMDVQLIETWAAAASGRLLDAGCGPGHWTHHLASRGADIRGIDLVPNFIDHARATYPDVPFDLGSIDAIEENDDSVGGVLSWFSTIHHAPARIAIPISEFARIIRPGGTLLLGYFDGVELEPFDHAVVRAYRWPVKELWSVVDAAGFDVIETHRREERGRRPVGAILCEMRAL